MKINEDKLELKDFLDFLGEEKETFKTKEKLKSYKKKIIKDTKKNLI